MGYLTLTEQRERDMRRLYRRLTREGKVNMNIIDLRDRADIIRNSRAPRLYISAKVAMKLVKEYETNGGATCRKEEAVRRQLYIVCEYRRLKASKLVKNKSAINICNIIVNQAAPSFFVSRQMTFRALFWYNTIKKRKERYEKKNRNMQRIGD